MSNAILVPGRPNKDEHYGYRLTPPPITLFKRLGLLR